MVATAALICALSVFNGLTSIAERMFDAFDPDLQISAKQGKVFKTSTIDLAQIQQLDGIDLVSESLEENALLKYSDRQQIILFKGVSPQFTELTRINELMFDGKFELRQSVIDNGVAGAGLAYLLGVSPGFLTPFDIYVPKRGGQVNMMNPSVSFNQRNVYLAGTFILNKEEYDEQMLIISIDLARELLNYEDEVTTIDLKVADGASLNKVKEQVQNIVGDDFAIKDRFEQQAEMYKMVNIEKWITFLIVVIISAIAVFNVVGSLSMLIIEKKGDINILSCLGVNNRTIEKVFLFEGWLIVLIGTMLGLVIGLGLCSAQEYLGIIKLGTSNTFVVEAFPVRVQIMDVLATFLTISLVGFLAVLYPILTLRKSLRTTSKD